MPLQRDPLLERLEPLRKLRRHRTLGYGIAVIAVAVASLLRAWFHDLFSPATFATFFFAIVVTSLLGTFRAGLLSVLLSVAAVRFFFMSPLHTFTLSLNQALALGLATLTLSLVAAGLTTLRDLIDRLWQQEANQRAVLDAQPVGVAVVDVAGIVSFANSTIERQFGFASGAMTGKQIGPLLPDTMPEIHAVYGGQNGQKSAPRTAHEVFAVRKNGTQFPAEVTLVPLVSGGGPSILLTVNDITERRIIERSQQVFSKEVQHRARNALAMVQAITARTLTPERPAREARDALLAMLASFGRTHEAVMLDDGITLKNIVDRELNVFHDAFSIHGSDLRLSAAAAMNMSLIVHELCTNAAKYGAFSVPQGKVLIDWQTTNGILAFSWIELDGPPPGQTAKPGFGTTLLHDLPRTWGAEARMEFSPQGLIYTLLVDEDSVAQPHEAIASQVA